MNEQIAGAGYILTFFENLINLNNGYSELKRRIISCKTHASLEKIQTNNTNAIPGEELKQITKAFHNINFFIDQTYIMSQALQNKVQSFKESKITELYKKTEDGKIPNLEELQQYIILINTAFIDDVMEKLLVDSKEIYSKLRK